MLVLLTISVVFSALALAAVLFLNRRKIPLNKHYEIENTPSFRPLFVPTDDEIRAFEREEKLRIAANLREKERQEAEEKIAEIKDFRKDWQVSPDKSKTGRLLRLAAESGNGEVFAEIAENILRLWRENRLENLSKSDLADLLESHFRTLPQQERTSGAMFILREEIAELRRKAGIV